MLSNFATVFSQVLVLFLLISLGYFCGKIRLINNELSDGMANLIMVLVAPCLMISSFQREFQPDLFHNFLIAFVGAFLIYAGSIIIANFIVRDTDESRKRVLRCTVIFSNCGMMSLALQNALFGSDGVFYGAAYISVFNLVFWTYGVAVMGNGAKLEPRRILLNPGILGTAAGLLFFFTSTVLPISITSACTYIADLNTPLAMLVIGQQLSRSRLSTVFTDGKIYLASALRLLAIPALVILSFRLFHITGIVAVTCVIASSAPAAASNSMLAIKYGQDSQLAVKNVSMQTLFSMLTMPIMVGLAQTVL